MRMETAAVIDTNPLVFHAAGGKRLGARAARHLEACEAKAAITYVPVAVIWELALLVRRSRIAMDLSIHGFFETLFSNPAFQPVDVTPEQVFLTEEIRPNDDPFDALICAVAVELELPLITRDAEIQDSGIVRTLW
ncbi:MAG: type II toxin-antitoxin system VapC family toxin [Vicinamibacteria bacterium]